MKIHIIVVLLGACLGVIRCASVSGMGEGGGGEVVKTTTF